ncbi:DUF2158 domain-containing protein [Sphingomonas sp. Leaf62]|uniref:DUF2158 domain-containing protein n=1 Tax=Sphingomonas sp. Leaf62 TaxID=1736228 RepID=UPI0012E242DB
MAGRFGVRSGPPQTYRPGVPCAAHIAGSRFTLRESPRIREFTVMFSVGDVVVLRSGGPSMTVLWSNDSETCCTWFPTSQSLEPAIRNFMSGVLKKID